MTVRPVSFDALPGFSPLFRAYAAGDAHLAPFFEHPDWNSDAALRRASDAAAAHPRDRAALVGALRAQQARWGADDAAERALERLLDPASVAVVTGQQVSLFGGPIYTVLKAATAVALARRTEAVTGRPAVPVFWLASEDHDFAEASEVTVGAASLRLTAPPRAPGERGPGPAGRVVLGESVLPLVDAAVAALPETEHAAGVAAALRAAYAPGTTLADAFGQLLRFLFAGTGLVLLDPDDEALKALAAPLFARAARDGHAPARSVTEAGEALVAAGFHAQIPAATAPGFFVLDERGRLGLDAEGDGYRVRATGERFTAAELEAVARDTPGRLSASVILRPCVQDVLLPTAAYVGGPGEIAYWAQLRGVYAWAGVPMPVVYPRASATLVDARTRRALARLGLAPEHIAGPADALFARLATRDAALDEDFAHAATALDAELARLAPRLAALDATFERSADAARARMHHALGGLRAKALRAERRTQSDLRRAAEHAVGALRPGGVLQERVLSALPFRALYGPAFAAHLIDALPLGEPAHQVVSLD